MARDNLIARNPVFYNTTLFRAFLFIDQKTIDNMGIQEYMDNVIMLREALKLRHAPFMNHDQ